MKYIYLLYRCDAWKSYSSMSLKVATTMPNVLEDIVIEEIENDYMEFGNSNYENYKEFILNNNVDAINTLLKYGYIQIVEDGEEQ